MADEHSMYAEHTLSARWVAGTSMMKGAQGWIVLPSCIIVHLIKLSSCYLASVGYEGLQTVSKARRQTGYVNKNNSNATDLWRGVDRISPRAFGVNGPMTIT